jgi:hypothetical protein
MQAELQEIFKQLRKHPCWNVEQGHGSFLTFHFGRPRLFRHAVIARKTGSGSTPQKTRQVYVLGEWTLRIDCCTWAIAQDGKLIAHSESPRPTIEKACAMLSGQKVRGIGIQQSCKTTFSFDLGAVLKTWPYSLESKTQWYLRCPRSRILAVDSGGQFTFKPYKKTTGGSSRNPQQRIQTPLVSVGFPPGQRFPWPELVKQRKIDVASQTAGEK